MLEAPPNSTGPALDLLVRGGMVLTMDSSGRVIPDGAVGAAAGQIRYVGPQAGLPVGWSARHTLDASGCLVLPGLVNTHGHLAMTLLRGAAEDLTLQDWLAQVWKIEQAVIGPQAVRLGSELALCEMIRAGVTCAANMYWFPEQTAEAALAAGFRLADGPVFTDLKGFAGAGGSSRAQAEAYLQSYCTGGLIHPLVQIHAIYSDSLERLEQAGQAARDFKVPFVTHAAETQAEVDWARKQHDQGPIEFLAGRGLLGPHTLLAHCVHLTPAEIELLAASGTAVAHCPESNLKLGSGIAPIPALLAAGVNLSLGTDGAASNNNLDLLEEARTAALLQKGLHHDPTLMPAERMARMLTIDGARALGLAALTGSLETGKQADLIVLDLDRPHLTPLFDPYAQILYAAHGRDVRDTIIQGQIVMQNRRLLTLDEPRTLAQAIQLRKLAGMA